MEYSLSSFLIIILLFTLCSTVSQSLLREAHEEEYRRVEAIENLNSKLPTFTEVSSSEVDLLNQETSEKEDEDENENENENEDNNQPAEVSGAGANTKNTLNRKTTAMRNRIKRRIERERLEVEEKIRKKISNDLARLATFTNYVIGNGTGINFS